MLLDKLFSVLVDLDGVHKRIVNIKIDLASSLPSQADHFVGSELTDSPLVAARDQRVSSVWWVHDYIP